MLSDRRGKAPGFPDTDTISISHALDEQEAIEYLCRAGSDDLNSAAKKKIGVAEEVEVSSGAISIRNGIGAFSTHRLVRVLADTSTAIMQMRWSYNDFTQRFDERVLAALVSLLASDAHERADAALAVIEAICRRYPQTHTALLSIARNELVSLREKNERAHAAVRDNFQGTGVHLARFVFILTSALKPGSEGSDFYSQFVLPVIFAISAPSAAVAVLLYSRRDPECLIGTLRHFNKRFLLLGTPAQCWALAETAKIIELHGQLKQGTGIEALVAALLQTALSSANHVVIERAIFVLESPASRSYILAHLPGILPRCFASLYNLGRKFWRAEQRCQALAALRMVMNENCELFESCLVRYNQEKQGKASDTMHSK
ncbi:hypothetical protein PAPHI01_2312 [Pancytospora philotis]|nr:hypothetical protein PAPHI01_2312 [Pancytospora philotis]